MREILNEKLKKTEWDDGDIWELVIKFDRVTKYWAQKNAWNGAEFDDLHQVGRLAMFNIIKQCRYRVLLLSYISHSLPGKMKDAAKAMRWNSVGFSLDGNMNGQDARDLSNVLLDRSELMARHALEQCCIDDMLHKMLSDDAMSLIQARLCGVTEKEIAAALGTSQPAVAKRMRRIRESLRPYLFDDTPQGE